MARYRVLEQSFINNSIAEPGAEVDYDGKPGKALELIEDEGKPARKAKAAADSDPALA